MEEITQISCAGLHVGVISVIGVNVWVSVSVNQQEAAEPAAHLDLSVQLHSCLQCLSARTKLALLGTQIGGTAPMPCKR